LFGCPACFAPQRTPPGHAGRTAVCPSCLRVLTVPAGGERFVEPPEPPARRTVAEVVSRSLDRPCRRCGMPVPLRSPECCHCGVKIT
jgi:ribosomal protein S27E